MRLHDVPHRPETAPERAPTPGFPYLTRYPNKETSLEPLEMLATPAGFEPLTLTVMAATIINPQAAADQAPATPTATLPLNSVS